MKLCAPSGMTGKVETLALAKNTLIIMVDLAMKRKLGASPMADGIAA